jgi:acyl-CoA thioester hydrolase
MRFRWPMRVYYEDTDAAGIVYYANYLKFMERARTEWLRSLGFEQTALVRDHRVLFVVSRVDVRYRGPARLDDRLEIGVAIQRLGRAGFDLVHEVARDDGVELCAGTVRVACLEAASMKPRPIPPFLLTELRRED